MATNDKQLMESGHEYVDLGLSVLWATCNIGAEDPKKYGDTFAWGEIEPCESNDQDSYKWYYFPYYLEQKNITSGLIKYCNHCHAGYYGFTDNLTTLLPEDDAAQAKWGGKWRMPNEAEWKELIDNCTWVWTHQDYNYGFLITSKKDGYTDRSIFLPESNFLGSGYWSNNLDTDDPTSAKCIYWNSDSEQVEESSYSRYERGLAVRPVFARKHEYVDLGLSVKWATFNVGATKPEEQGDLFAWGETDTKNIFDFDEVNYKWYEGSKNAITKYCNNKDFGKDGFVDHKMQLDPEDDVAHVKWGENWRMPTRMEFYELLTDCSWIEETRNGVKGFLIKSNKEGYTDRSIFFPSDGDQDGCWSSSINKEDRPSCAWYISFFITPATDGIQTIPNDREHRGFVRPVCP